MAIVKQIVAEAARQEVDVIIVVGILTLLAVALIKKN